MKKLFSFRLNEELMESVRELATAEGISVTKLVENVLEQHIQQETTRNVADQPIRQRTIEPELKQPRGIDASLLRELLLELLFDRGVHREVPQSQTSEMQELKELKEQVKSLEHIMRAVLKENLKDANPLSDYSQCNT